MTYYRIIIIVWHEIHQRINKVSMDIQVSTANVPAIVPLYSSLIAFINNVRNNFPYYEEESMNLNLFPDYTSKRKKKQPTRSKCLDGTNNPGVILSVKEHFMYNTHYVICDTLLTELKKETILTKNNKKKNWVSL